MKIQKHTSFELSKAIHEAAEEKPTNGRFKDIAGEKFGKLLVIGFVGRRGTKALWGCVCDCGNESIVLTNDLKSGHTTSCGCFAKQRTIEFSTKHGLNKSKIQSVHNSMMQRCYNEKKRGYKNYGGRGISVCERWHKLENFFEDMGNVPNGMTLERIDNNGNYCPDNCRWATQKEQLLNRRNTIFFEYKGERLPLSELVDKYSDHNYLMVYKRIKRGMDIEEALLAPSRHKNLIQNDLIN